METTEYDATMIEIHFKSRAGASVLAVPSRDGESVLGAAPDLAALLARFLEAEHFDGKPGSALDVFLPGEEPAHIVILGVGKADARAYEKAGATLVRRLAACRVGTVDVAGIAHPDDRARFALGARLASYRFDTYRTRLGDDKKPSLRNVALIGPEVRAAQAAYRDLDAAVAGVALARDLVSEPPNVLFPDAYARHIADNLPVHGLKVTILDEAQMQAENMGCLLAVGMGSAHESRLCVIEWRGSGKKTPPLALIGKGVTFDTGGISIKPGANMDEMKGDMAGSAAVVGTMLALAKRKAKVNAVGLIGLVENMPGSKAQRPGDIVISASGQSVEVLNTDAEGRLVLADLLWYAQQHYAPCAMIDLATLTGAIIIALGNEHAGLFANDEALAANITAAGEAEGETVWRLPLGAAYDRLIDSKVADMKNIGGRGAGSITAAQFLRRFVDDGMPWAHLDIAGKAWKSGKGDALNPVWATGFGVRLLNRLVRDSFEDGHGRT